MSFTRIAVWIGVVLFGLMCFLAAIGFTAMIGPLVTVALLVLLIGGGNLMRGRSPYAAYGRTAPRGPTVAHPPTEGGPTPPAAQPPAGQPPAAQPPAGPPAGPDR